MVDELITVFVVLIDLVKFPTWVLCPFVLCPERSENPCFHNQQSRLPIFGLYVHLIAKKPNPFFRSVKA